MRSSVPARFSLFSLQTHLRLRGIKARAKVPLDKMRDSEEDAPVFSDSTGEALNASAWNLVREATASATNVNAKNEDLNDDPASMRWIAPVEMTPGRHKYVLMKVYNEETNEKKFLVRSYARCSYHAENFQKAVGELRKDERMATLKAHVIGGGRIEYDKEKKRVFVYGYSMTFGRTPGCNKKTMEIIRKRFAEEDGDGPLAECEWSDEGY
jgi:phosphohistidine phosphatase